MQTTGRSAQQFGGGAGVCAIAMPMPGQEHPARQQPAQDGPDPIRPHDGFRRDITSTTIATARTIRSSASSGPPGDALDQDQHEADRQRRPIGVFCWKQAGLPRSPSQPRIIHGIHAGEY